MRGQLSLHILASDSGNNLQCRSREYYWLDSRVNSDLGCTQLWVFRVLQKAYSHTLT